MSKKNDNSTLLKIIIFIIIVAIIIFLSWKIINIIGTSIIVFSIFLLFLLFNYDNKKNNKNEVIIKKVNQDKIIKEQKISKENEIHVKEASIKEVYRDNKSKENIKNGIEIKKKDEKKPLKKQEKKEIVKEKDKDKEQEEKKEDKEINEKKENKDIKNDKEKKYVIISDKPKKPLSLKIIKEEKKDKENKINIVNLKVENKKKFKENSLKIKKQLDKNPIKNIVVDSTFYNSSIKNSNVKLTNDEKVMCSKLSLFILNNNKKKITSVDYTKDKDGYIKIPFTNIKMYINGNTKYMVVPKKYKNNEQVIGECNEKENKEENMRVYLTNNLNPLKDYLQSELQRYPKKKKKNLLSLFSFDRNKSERILKKEQEKKRKKELINLAKLYENIANLYHKSGDYSKEATFVLKAITKLKSKGLDTTYLENRLQNVYKLIEQKEKEKEKKLLKKKDNN